MQRIGLRRRLNHWARSALARLPQEMRFAIYRRMIDCDPAPDPRLELKVANTRQELEDCFRILHDAYVSSGFMKPAPSGLRVTPYHALPTTTTLCAKFDGRVVGTISMIREGVFGFPLQAVFDLSEVRAQQGQIAEISALAIHPDFRKTGGTVLFPLMKFMYQYCSEYFDTRHLVIAVNPDRIELYQSLLFFEKLQERTVDSYDFANGAPAVGASLDLAKAREVFRKTYSGRSSRKDLYNYFVGLRLENIKLPARKYFTTNDPVLTPEIIDYFFNGKSSVFQELDDRKRALLWSIYDQPEYRGVLPLLDGPRTDFGALRKHQRFSVRCPAKLQLTLDGRPSSAPATVIELSLSGFQAQSDRDLPIGVKARARVELGVDEVSEFDAVVVRQHANEAARYYGFKADEVDSAWRRCVSALETGNVAEDL